MLKNLQWERTSFGERFLEMKNIMTLGKRGCQIMKDTT